MTREEWRAGLLRLAALTVTALVCLLLLALVLQARGEGSFRRALATSLSIGGLLPLLAGVATFLSAGPVRAEGRRLRGGTLRVVDPGERRRREHLAAGLIAAGAALLGAALALG